jgi:hypothetical protein
MWGRKPKNTQSRRSRVPGSDRSVFSYYQNRVIPDSDSVKATSEREKKRASQVKRHHIPMIITLLVIAACFMYILTLSSNPKVIVVNEQDQATASLLRSPQVYESAIHKMLESSVFNKSKITVNTTGLARSIQTEFPEVSEAIVSLPLVNRRPVVYLQITQPAFLLTSAQDTYAIDPSGRVIMKGDSTLPHSDLAKIDDQTGQKPEIGKAFLPASQVKFMQDIQAQLKAKGVSDLSFTLPAIPDEAYLKIAGKSYIVKLTFSGDPRLQVGTFLAVRQKLETDKVNPAEYIDVRVEDRAYYK